jgi:DNA invertase Pin-like site-specific DNA recombinase
MLGVFAEFETAIRKERQLEGIAKAKANGIYEGRKPIIDMAHVRAPHKAGKTPTTIARELKLARSSVYQALGMR